MVEKTERIPTTYVRALGILLCSVQTKQASEGGSGISKVRASYVSLQSAGLKEGNRSQDVVGRWYGWSDDDDGGCFSLADSQ